MISADLLWVVLLIEGGLVVAGLAVVALHGLWLRRRQLVDGRRARQGHAVLAEAVAGDNSAGAVATLGTFPARVQRMVVEQLAVSVSGQEAERVGFVAESLGLVSAAQRRCRSRRWWRRLLGAHQLNVYRCGDEGLAEMFDDPHPAVRAQAVAWAGDARRADLAPRLVAALQDPSALCRHTAADSILRAGAPLVAALAAEVDACDGQAQADLMAVLSRRPDPRYRAAGLAAAGDSGLPGRRVAAASLLGGIGGPDAAAALVSLLHDDDPSVRTAAADGLLRQRHVLAAPDLAPLLRDPAFEVRRSAGAALAGLGPGGILLLRRYLEDEDPFAADMARYALDVAALRGVPT